MTIVITRGTGKELRIAETSVSACYSKMQACDTIWYQDGPHLIACSPFPEDAARIRERASSEYRSVSGYLLYVLERSFRIEQVVVRGASAPLIYNQARGIIGPQNKKHHTAVHLCCTVEQAAQIRKYAAKRQLSISDFVIFSLRRLWIAAEKLQKG